MALFVVRKEHSSLGEFLGWAVYFQSGGDRVVGPFAELAAAYEAAYLLEQEYQRLQDLALEKHGCIVQATNTKSGQYSGNILEILSQCALIHAGRDLAHIHQISSLQEAGVQAEIGRIVRIKYVAGKAINNDIKHHVMQCPGGPRL